MNGQKRITWAIGLAMLLMLSACGQQSNPAASALDTTSVTDTDATTYDASEFTNDPTTATADTATDSVEATPVPPVEATPSPSPSATSSTLPSLAPTPAPALGESLVQNVAKSYPGLLAWEKCRISFQLRNPFWLRTLKERMVVTFTHKGAVVEVQEFQVQLSPANISNRECTSTKHADDASVAIYLY